MRQSMHELRETDESTMTITLKIPKVSTFTNSHTNHTYTLQISHLECVICVLYVKNACTLVGERENVSNHESRDAYEYSNIHIHQTNTTEYKHSNMTMS